MSILTAVMDWFAGRSSQEDSTTNPIQRTPRRPKQIDLTEGLTVNDDLTRGLWRNTYPDIKLGASLAFAPIFVPVAFMGVPVPMSDDERTQDMLTAIVDKLSQACIQIHKLTHRDGTCWVWPLYSTEDGLVWEFIRDSTVSDIIKDLITGKVIEIRTDERLSISVGEADVRSVRRRRSFTAQRVKITYEGGTAEGLENVEYANPSGELPVAFANNVEPNETRGISDYSRILPDLKNYHDIDLAWTTMLAKFRAKLVVGVKDVDQWLADNGYATIADVDVATADLLIVNVGKEETIELLPPPETSAYEAKQKNTFRKIVEASGIPEIAWGLKTEGNHASAEEQMGSLVQYSIDKRGQKQEGYHRLFGASLRLMGIARMTTSAAFQIEWNRLDAVSDRVRAEIFNNFAQGLGRAMQWASLTDKQLHALWKQNFPEATEENYEEYVEGMTRAAKFRQFSQASLGDAFDVVSPYEEPDENTGDDEEQEVEGDASSQNIRVL